MPEKETTQKKERINDERRSLLIIFYNPFEFILLAVFLLRL